MRRTMTLAVAIASAPACHAATSPPPRADRPGITAEGAADGGSLSGALVTNVSQVAASLVPLADAEVIMVRVGDLLPASDSLRNPADGGGGPFEHCGGVTAAAIRTRSDAAGRFAIAGLAPGSYDVMIRKGEWGFTAYCAFQVRASGATPVTIYVPPGQLSG